MIKLGSVVVLVFGMHSLAATTKLHLKMYFIRTEQFLPSTKFTFSSVIKIFLLSSELGIAHLCTFLVRKYLHFLGAQVVKWLCTVQLGEQIVK